MSEVIDAITGPGDAPLYPELLLGLRRCLEYVPSKTLLISKREDSIPARRLRFCETQKHLIFYLEDPSGQGQEPEDSR